MKKQIGYTIIEALMALTIPLILAGVYGWVWNIVKLVGMSFDPLTGLLVVRIVGIFIPPVGAVVGFI